jgi:hypothetical protein
LPEVDYLPYANESTANVIDQPTFAAAPWPPVGFAAGIAQSSEANKLWRQSSVMCSAIATLISQELNVSVLDDGNVANLVTLLKELLLALQPRQVLTAATTNFYVNGGTGSDTTGNGTTAAPWQTIQHAANFVVNQLDFNGQQVIINLASGTYAPFTQNANPVGCFGPSSLIYNGSLANPASVIIHSAAAATPCINTNGVFATLQGMTFTSSGDAFSHCILNGPGCILEINNVIFGPCTGGHVASLSGGIVYFMGPYTINGGAVNHWVAANGGSIGTFGEVEPGIVSPFSVTVTGTPAFSTCFALATDGSIALAPTVLTAFTGAATGQRFIAQSCGIINVNGGGVNFFPGSTAGVASTTTYGVYSP